MMARKKRNHISRRAVEERRDRVLELRLAGLTPADIAEVLRKEELFKHTTQDTVWNDIKAVKKRAELEEIESEPIVKAIFQKSRDSNNVIGQAAHMSLKEINHRIAQVQEQIADVVEQLQDPLQPLNSRGQLIIQHDRLVSLAGKLRAQARDETRVIISINKTLTDMPRKLGLIYEKKEVGVHDITKEKMIQAIKNEKDPERKEELIRAAELFAGII